MIKAPFKMNEGEYERVFRMQHKLSSSGKKDMKNYNLRPDKQIRLQMALLHKCRGDFRVNIDFSKREKLLKHAMMFGNSRKMGKYGTFDWAA